MSEAKKFNSVSSREFPPQLLDLLIKCEMLYVTVTLLCAWKGSRWLKATSHINKSVYVCCEPACFGASYCVNNTPLNSRIQTVPKTNKSWSLKLSHWVTFCSLQIAVCKDCAWTTPLLRQTCLGAHRWAQVHLLFIQRGRWLWKRKLRQPDSSNGTQMEPKVYQEWKRDHIFCFCRGLWRVYGDHQFDGQFTTEASLGHICCALIKQSQEMDVFWQCWISCKE